MTDYVALLNDILKNVQGEPGWKVMGISAGKEGPGFAYTIGLYHNYKHPEIILFGLPIETALTLLNDVGDRVKGGEVIQPNVTYTDLVQKYPVMFKPISNNDSDTREDLLGIAVRFYGHVNFPVLQFIWTDPKGKFPWESDCEMKTKLCQPLAWQE
jgi:hypothetical protein